MWNRFARVIVVMMVCLLGGSAYAQDSENLLGEELIFDEEDTAQRISMDFREAGLRDVIKAFSAETGLNVIATNDVEDQLLTLYLEEVTVLDALDQILLAANLTYVRPPGSDIYIVRPISDEGTLITRVYRLRYARVSQSVLARSISAFSGITPFEAARATNQVTGGGETATGSQSDTLGVDLIIEQLLSDLGTLSVDERTNTLIVTDDESNFPRIESALAALDVRTPQILIETELLEIGLSGVDEKGLKYQSNVADGYTATLAGGARNSRFPFSVFNLDSASWVSSTSGSPSDTALAQNDGAFTSSVLSLPTMQIISQMLHTDTRTKVLARPKVLTLDNESAVIRLSTDEVVGFETETDPTTGGIASTPQRTLTGILLSVTPQVNEDDFITLLVEPSVTTADNSSLTAPDGSSAKDPKTRSARSLVRIHNGDTLVIGGLIDLDETVVEQKVPFIGDLPLIGKLFSYKSVTENNNELVIFVTPRIVEENVPMDMASAGFPVVLPPNWQRETLSAREQDVDARRDNAISKTLDLLE